MQSVYYKLFNDMLDSHLLIAGKTGSGKSVCLHNLIYHGLFKNPKEFQMVLIDPKKVELNRYTSVPHCIAYADEIDDIYNVLKHCGDIMMDRYKIMKKQGMNKWNGPTLYIFIDEYADLVLSDRKRIEPLVQRIGQLGRASKVFCCLATQYINGIINTRIRCNFDTRICLHTASREDSKKIMDCTGCEILPPYGYMYFLNKDGCNLYTVPMVPDETIKAMIEYWNPPGILERLKRKTRRK